MADRLFLYLGTISHGHAFILLSHLVLVVAILMFLVKKVTSKPFEVVPTTTQNIFEVFLQGVISMGTDVMGEDKARKYLPLIATIGLLVLTSNLIGIIPGFESPTSNINFTLSLALIVFAYYNYEGIKEHGAKKYFAHFAGPVAWLAPLMFPIEIISHLSRIVSLSFRLFGNIKGDDLFLLVLLMLAPWLVPLPAFFILLFMAFLQTFIFMILTYVYLAGAVLMEEEH